MPSKLSRFTKRLVSLAKRAVAGDPAPTVKKYVEADKRSVKIARFVLGCDLLDDLDSVEFVAVNRGGQADCRSRLVTIDDSDWQFNRVVVKRGRDGIPELRLLTGWNRPTSDFDLVW